MIKKLIFKGAEINVGQKISLTTSSIPLQSFNASVAGFVNNSLLIISTQIKGFNTNGKFEESDVIDISIDLQSQEAVIMETGGKFSMNQEVYYYRKRDLKKTIFQVKAAFDGIASGWDKNGVRHTGNVRYLFAL